MSWTRLAGGYQLMGNRDEPRSRPPADPPAVHEGEGGVRFIAPVDPEGGGTWTLVNSLGLSLSLLNAHPPGWAESGPFVSRGSLVWSLASLPTATQVGGVLGGVDLSSYRPFTLLSLDRTGGGVVGWDGVEISREPLPPRPFLTSSSFDPESVAAARARAFGAVPASSMEAVLDFHRSHEPERGPYSTCMHRDDAKSVSCSRIRVGGGMALFSYAPGSPCSTPFEFEVDLFLDEDGAGSGGGSHSASATD